MLIAAQSPRSNAARSAAIPVKSRSSADDGRAESVWSRTCPEVAASAAARTLAAAAAAASVRLAAVDAAPAPSLTLECAAANRGGPALSPESAALSPSLSCGPVSPAALSPSLSRGSCCDWSSESTNAAAVRPSPPPPPAPLLLLLVDGEGGGLWLEEPEGAAEEAGLGVLEDGSAAAALVDADCGRGAGLADDETAPLLLLLLLLLPSLAETDGVGLVELLSPVAASSSLTTAAEALAAALCISLASCTSRTLRADTRSCRSLAARCKQGSEQEQEQGACARGRQQEGRRTRRTQSAHLDVLELRAVRPEPLLEDTEVVVPL
jgi:hypothetical protein